MAGKGSGWHNESRRHSLAARGVKTAQPKLGKLIAKGDRITLYSLEDDVREETENYFEEVLEEVIDPYTDEEGRVDIDDVMSELERHEPHDRIHEMADGGVPVYTSDLMGLAAENPYLATGEPELGPAFDGSPTPVNIVAANVYERLEETAWDHWRELIEDENKVEEAIKAKKLKAVR